MSRRHQNESNPTVQRAICFGTRSSHVTGMVAAPDACGRTGRSGLVLPGRSDRGLGPRAVPDGYPPGRSRYRSRHAPHLGARTSPGAPAGATGSLVDLLCLAAFLADPARTGLAMASMNRRAQRRATLGIRAPQAEELQEPRDPQRRFERGVGLERNPRPPQEECHLLPIPKRSPPTLLRRGLAKLCTPLRETPDGTRGCPAI
jgi:hypothetical protein